MSISDDYNAISTHDKANLITYLCTQCGLLLQVVHNFCVNHFVIVGLQSTDARQGRKIFCSFKYASRKKLLFRYQVFPTALD